MRPRGEGEREKARQEETLGGARCPFARGMPLAVPLGVGSGSDLRTGLDVGFVGFEEVRPLIRRFLPVAARTGERLRVRARLSRLESEESEESFSSGIAGGEVARDRAAAERVTGAK